MFIHCAVAPVAKWPVGVFVLSSHTENILIGFDVDLMCHFVNGLIHYFICTVTGKSFFDHFDLELQTKVGARLLPVFRVVPAELLPITDAQVNDFCWPHNLSQVESLCVGLEARVAVYVDGEGDTVLFFFIWAAGILAVNS